MDDRTRRLGEHAAATEPAWARQSLGPVPDDPVARLDWEQRASLVAAYRERYGYAHPDDPIGPEPSKASPEARAAWHTALAALGRVDGIDLRGCTDGDLWLRRSTYERETAWAPPHVTEELRLMRTAERDAHVNAIRADHEGRAAKDEQTADRHRQLAAIWRALEAKAAEESEMFAAVQATRRQWETVTETTRTHRDRRRRRTAPPPPRHADRAAPPSPRRGRRHHSPRDPDPVPRSQPALGSQRDLDGQLALGLTLQAARDEIPAQVLRIRENARIVQAKLDDLASLPLPAARGRRQVARSRLASPARA